MELYLVTIDTTYANGLGKSLQNYGFVLATDTNTARERFIMPLRNSVQPQVLAALFSYTYAYKLSEITEDLTEENPLWTYASTNPNRKKGQQVRTPYFSNNFQETVKKEEPVQEQVVAPVVEDEFKAPEGVTDPNIVAMMRQNFELMKEIKKIKNTPSVQPKESAKKIVAELEGAFRAPPPVRSEIPGTQGLNPSTIPIPQVNGVTSLPKGKIDRTTLERLKQNMQPSQFETID